MKSKVVQIKIIYNTLVQLIEKGASLGLGLLAVSLLTRYLGTSNYGKYTLVITYLTFFSLIGDMGFNVTLVRELTNNSVKSISDKATFINLKLILISLSIVFPIIALLFFPYSNELKTAIIIGSIAVATGNLISYGTSILQSQLKLDYVALIDLITKVITIISIIYFIHIKANLYYIIFAIFLGNVAGLAATIYYIRDFIVFRVVINKKTLDSILKVGFPLGITSILSLFYFKIDTVLLSIIKSPYEVGIYGLSYNILENILMLWGLIMASIFPLLSQYYGTRDVARFKDLFRKTLLLLTFTSIGIIIFGNVFDYLIMRILGGSKFFASMIPFKILLYSVPFFFLNNVFYSVIVSFGRTKYLISLLIFSLVINIVLNLYAIPKYGYIGASVTTVVTEIITSLAYFIVILYKFKREADYWRITN